VAGQCTRTIILPGLFIELSPHNHFSIGDACPGHILQCTRGIEMKLGSYVDVNKRKCRRQEP